MKNFVKRGLRWSLARAGKKLVAADAIVIPDGHRHLGPEWHIFKEDGVASAHTPAFHQDSEFLAAIDHIRDRQLFDFVENPPTYRLAVAWQLARAAARVDGDLLEFGTYRGGFANVFLRATDSISSHKRLYLYDSFAGIPENGLTDRERANGMSGRYSCTSVVFVREALGRHASRVEFRAGFIPTTLDQSGPDRISFMHVDLNGAVATRHALEWAYPRWSLGGICLLDDYLWGGYEDQRQCVESFFSEKQRQILGLPTGQGIVLNI